MSVIELQEGSVTQETTRRTVRVVLLGLGRVGQAVATLANARRTDLHDLGVDLRLQRALIRDPARPRAAPPLELTTERDAILDGADVVIEVLGGVEPARTLVAEALDRGIGVVTANKSLMAAHGAALRRLACRRGATLAFEAAVVAGVPFVGALTRRPLLAEARRLEGILNGTSHVVLGRIARGATFVDALAFAIERGYAEPDSRADVDGRDAAEKLAVLLQLCGAEALSAAVLPRLGIDAVSPADLDNARRLGGVIKPVAFADLTGLPHATAWVGPAFLPAHHALARIDGVDNALTITGRRGERVTFAGPGAGPAITAATILDDVIEIVRQPAPPPPPQLRQPGAVADPQPPEGRWLLRCARQPGTRVARLTAELASRRVAAVRAVSDDTHVYALTATTSWAVVHDVLRTLDASGAQPLALPVLD